MVYQPTSRVLTVLELLQTHGQMTGQELSKRLEVDARTIRRYVTTLQDMGIPVETEFGRYGGYALRPAYKLPPLMFSNDEVLVLTLGLMMARRAGLAGGSSAVESALAKIERVLPEGMRDQIQALQTNTQINADKHPDTLVGTDVITLLTLASQQRRQVQITYSGDERVIDPYSIIRHNEHWYTVGYCHLRDALRTFRLDRIDEVEVLDTTFTPPPHFDAVTYMMESFEAIPDTWNIEILLHMPLEIARRLIPRSMATLKQKGQHVLFQASMPDLDEIARLIISLNVDFTIIEPDELYNAFLEIAYQIQSMMKDAP